MEDNNLIMKDSVNSSDEIKKIFLTAIVHQLRTSLSGARWSIETAIKDENCPHKDVLLEGLKKIIYSIDTCLLYTS